MTLEAQLLRITEVHNLTSLSFNLYRRADGTFWIGSYAHAGEGVCGSCNNSATSVTDAIKLAIVDLNARRFHPNGPELDELAPMSDLAEAE